MPQPPEPWPPARPGGAPTRTRATIAHVAGDEAADDGEERPETGWGRDWAPASWSDSADSVRAADPGPAAGRPGGGTGPGRTLVPGVTDTLEQGFAVLRRSPGAVFAGGAALGVMLLATELVGWWVLRGWAVRLLPDGRALADDPARALAGIDGAGLVTAALTVTGVVAVAWVLVVTTRTVVDGVVAAAAGTPAPVPVRRAFGVARHRLRPLVLAGLVVGLASAAVIALPVAALLLVSVHPLLGVLAGGLAGLAAAPALVWLWVRSSLLGAGVVAGRAGVRGAWREGGRVLRRGLGSAVVLLVVGAALAVAAGGAASVPLQYLAAIAWQESPMTPMLWLDRAWWDGMHLEVFLVAAAHAVATAVGYPLLSVIAALLWIERSGSSGDGPGSGAVTRPDSTDRPDAG